MVCVGVVVKREVEEEGGGEGDDDSVWFIFPKTFPIDIELASIQEKKNHKKTCKV